MQLPRVLAQCGNRGAFPEIIPQPGPQDAGLHFAFFRQNACHPDGKFLSHQVYRVAVHDLEVQSKNIPQQGIGQVLGLRQRLAAEIAHCPRKHIHPAPKFIQQAAFSYPRFAHQGHQPGFALCDHLL